MRITTISHRNQDVRFTITEWTEKGILSPPEIRVTMQDMVKDTTNILSLHINPLVLRDRLLDMYPIEEL